MSHQETVADLIGLFDNSDEPKPIWNEKGTIVGMTVSFMVAAVICCGLRLYTRCFWVRCASWDDLLVGISTVVGAMGCIALSLSAKYGFGQHFLDLTAVQMGNYLRCWYVVNASYCMSTSAIKMSLLLQYLRFYPRGQSKTRVCCIGVLIFTGLWGLAYATLAWIPCQPPSRFWTTSNWDPEKCWAFGSLYPAEFFATYASHTATNMVLDIFCLVIPVTLLFRKDENLQEATGTVARPTRKGLYGLLAVGLAVIIISIWRLLAVLEHQAATWPTFDPTWYGPKPILLGVMEVQLSIACASVPVFWPAVSSRIADAIFVTQEIKITRKQRYSTEEGGARSVIIDDETTGTPTDEFELHVSKMPRYQHRRTSSGSSGSIICAGQHARGPSLNSKAGSETSLTRATEKKAVGHYEDEYVVTQVDPLRRGNAYAVASEVVANPVKKQRSRTGF